LAPQYFCNCLIGFHVFNLEQHWKLRSSIHSPSPWATSQTSASETTTMSSPLDAVASLQHRTRVGNKSCLWPSLPVSEDMGILDGIRS
jgi:hypothetical protein